MPKQNKKTYNIFDIMVDDILEATDEEIINEAIEDGIDIDKEVFKIKRIFNKCRYDVAKKIVEDKKEVRAEHQTPLVSKMLARKLMMLSRIIQRLLKASLRQRALEWISQTMIL